MISEARLQQLAADTLRQPPYLNQPFHTLNPLPANASQQQVHDAIENARSTVVSRNFVSTFRCLPRDIMTGATPLPSSTQSLFTAMSWKTIQNRRLALRNETARSMQCGLNNVSDTHPKVTQHMKACIEHH